jgi:hypothetical protein
MTAGAESRVVPTRAFAVSLVIVSTALVAVAGLPAATIQGRSDPPLLVPWHRIGNLTLGESKASVEREYGSEGQGYHVLIRGQGIVQGYYRLHDSRVYVTFEDGRLNELDFTTRYYRTTNGFGVGSTIPLGPCYRTATNPCEHRWHGFIWNAWVKERSHERHQLPPLTTQAHR